MSGYYGSQGSFRRGRQREEVDPMSSLANIGDIMLVFACGLMIALVAAYKVDLSSVSKVEVEETEEVTNIESMDDLLEGEGNAYIQRGTVYQDPVTGTLYLVEEVDASSDDAASEGDTASEDSGEQGGAEGAASGTDAAQ